MKNYPTPIKLRNDLDLKQGIKSSLPEMKESFALLLTIYLSNDRASQVEYSVETNSKPNKIQIKKELFERIEAFFSNQIQEIQRDALIKRINENALFTSQLEPLQVAIELFWKLAKINFVENFASSHERTGGERFNKRIKFSTNMILLHETLSDFNGEIPYNLKNLLFSWLIGTQPQAETHNILEKIKTLLTIFSEETHCKIRKDNGEEVFFQQEGIYSQLLEGNSVLNQDAKENVGPFRILKSFVKSDLHKYVKEDSQDGFVLKNVDTVEFKEYADSVATYLDLIPKRTVIQIENESQPLLPINIASKQTIFYGAPGTGKSHKVKNIVADTSEERKEIITFHPDYDNASFVGGYKPSSEGDEIKYKFVPQVFANIYVKAWQNLDNKYYLVIEEINRGNCAEIFGDVFQLLDRNYNISPSKELKEHLQKELGENHEGIAGGKMRLPDNLIILATMNTSDQSLFPMDSAFKRRWNWEYVPIEYNANYDENGEPNESFEYVVKLDENSTFKWIEFIEKVNKNHIRQNTNLGADKCIGNYFIKPSEREISIEDFVQKVIFYLWNDVFRDEENEVFDKDVFYEDFFPIKTKGIEKVRKILANVGVEIITLENQPAQEEIIAENENPS